MSTTLTTLVTRLEKATNRLDHSPASNVIRDLVIELRAFDEPDEGFCEIVPFTPGPRPRM